MIKERTSIFLYCSLIGFAAVLLALATYLQPGTHLEFIGGIDHAWAYALNRAFDERWVMGRDLYFTFGPLGFLEHTRVVSLDMLYISSAFSFTVSVVMNAALLHLAWLSSPERHMRIINLALAITLVIFSFPHIQRLLIAGYALLMLHWMTGRWIYLVLFSVTATLCVLIKFSYGAASLALLTAYLFLVCRKQKRFMPFWIGVGSLVLSYLLIWFMIYRSLQGAYGFIEGELHISRGNASAMALNPENNWLAVLVFYLALLFAAWIMHRQSESRFALFPLVFLLPLLVWTKYTFSQQEAFHMVPIIAFAMYVCGLFVVALPRLLSKLTVVVAMVVIWFAWVNMHTEDTRAPDYPNVPRLTIGEPDILKPHRLKNLFNIWQTAEKERLQPLVLPEKMRAMLGHASVDVYPWDLTVVPVNELNWRPRPLFQIYISYLPFLDQKNADFFNDDNRAPEYILWHHHFYQDIMNRYALSSEPLTVASILDHYRMVECEGYFCLWQRQERSQLQTREIAGTATLRWNEWMEIPAHKANVLRASLKAHRTLFGKLNLMAWKEGNIEIDYELADGSIKTHLLLIDNAVSGVWISPYIESYPGDTSIQVTELPKSQLKHLLSQPLAAGNMEAVRKQANGFFVGGWIGVPNVADKQENFVLAHNNDRAYLLAVNEVSRGDVSAHFATMGVNMTPDCGIHQVIDEQQLAPGNYKLRFVAKHGARWSPLHDQGFTLAVAPRNTDNPVKRFRIRTSRPWAFDEAVSVQWQELAFENGVPWKPLFQK